MIPEGKTIKKGRSSKYYALGLVNTAVYYLPKISDGKTVTTQRLPFFEIDSFDYSLYLKILSTYQDKKYDVLTHRTKKGYHFLSPTMLSIEEYKDFHDSLKGINKKCPMITLRITDNKYGKEEKNYFYEPIHILQFSANRYRNASEACYWLYSYFGVQFDFEIMAAVRTVRYPLPVECDRYHLENDCIE